MKVKMLGTKTTALVAFKAVCAVTIIPLGKFADFTHRKFDENRQAIQVHYIKEHLNEFTAQEKYEAVRMFGSDVAWLNDPVMDAAFALQSQQMKHDDYSCRRFLDKYDYLTSVGVQPCERHVAWYSEAHRIVSGTFEGLKY